MYFVKAKKNLEEQDARDIQERNRRDRYQRSDSARLVLQAVPTQQSKQADEGKSLFNRSDSKGPNFGSEVDASSFRPEELPDGACYRPRKDLTQLPSTSSAGAVAATATSGSRGESQDITNPGTGLMEHVRPVEYIGTFSVSGSDKEVRERQMESQLEHMRNAQERRPVQLVISAAGVKVILPENNNTFMEHSLKRIWYATCDPEYRQFSFLAREPKTSAEVQYCHAFVTGTAEQAEELITLIGEAFKSTYSEQQQKEKDQKDQQQQQQQQPKKQPTFHELIEQQVLQQQAKFREIELEAQTALQQTLNQIATPTPFSERAQSRMEERRRQSEDLSVASPAIRRDWAKHEVHRVKHTQQSPDRSSNNSSCSPASNPNRRSEIPTRQSTPKSSPFKRNSVPPQVTLSSSQPHPLSALAIKESMESKAASKGSKFKGSPVTALKNEIDRRLAMSNGDDPPPPPPSLAQAQVEQSRQQSQQHAMANRPLPQPPSESSGSPHKSRASPSRQQTAPPSSSSQPNFSCRELPPTPLEQQRRHQQQQQHRHLLPHQRSLDDYHLPRSSTSPQVVSTASPAASRSPSGGAGPAVRMRDSPRRRQPRPMSEIATSSSGHGGARPGGSSYYEQQRQSLLSNFAASFQLQPHTEAATVGSASNLRADGMYIYGPGPAPAPREGETYSLASNNLGKRGSWAPEGTPQQFYYRQSSPSNHHQQQQLYQHQSSPKHQQQQLYQHQSSPKHQQQQLYQHQSSPKHQQQQLYQHQQQPHQLQHHDSPPSYQQNGRQNLRPGESTSSSTSSSSSSSPAVASHQARPRWQGSPQHTQASASASYNNVHGDPAGAARYQNDTSLTSAPVRQGPG